MEDDSCDDFEPLIFDIEEIECRMTDMEERDKSEEVVNNRSVRGSLFLSPRDMSKRNPLGRDNESMMSSSNNLMTQD